jgi:Zn-dependent alcohol dehydrogenase
MQRKSQTMHTDTEIPRSMKAAVLVGNAPELTIVRINVPRPRAGEALVRVASCGVCHTDLHVIRGEVAFPRPAVLGHEVSGTIVRIGDGTTDTRGLSVQDNVVSGFIMPCTECEACLRGRDDLCSNFFAQNRLKGTLYDGESRLTMPDGSFLAMYSMGGLAEYCVIPLAALVAVPGTLDLDTACILGCAGLTAFGAVFRSGQVQRGNSVAVIGAGGVGSSLIQMAHAAGADPIIAVDIADEKLDRARELGATNSVNSLQTDPVEAVRSLTSTGGVDVAFEALGNPATFGQASRMLADGGRMVAVGIAAGAATAEVEITPLVRRGYTITGSFGGRTRTDLPKVVNLAETGAFNVDSVVTRRFTIDDANEAYQLLKAGQITGRAIVSMR